MNTGFKREFKKIASGISSLGQTFSQNGGQVNGESVRLSMALANAGNIIEQIAGACLVCLFVYVFVVCFYCLFVFIVCLFVCLFVVVVGVVVVVVVVVLVVVVLVLVVIVVV